MRSNECHILSANPRFMSTAFHLFKLLGGAKTESDADCQPKMGKQIKLTGGVAL